MKAKIIILILCVFFIVTLQSTALEYIKIMGVKPNILLVMIIVYALIKGNIKGAIFGFLIGLTQDIVTGKLLGFYSLIGLYLGLVIGSINRRLYRENFAVIVFFTFISSIVYELIVYLLHVWGANLFMGLGIGPISIFEVFGSIILPEAIYNAVISIFVYVLLSKIEYTFEEYSKPLRKY